MACPGKREVVKQPARSRFPATDQMAGRHTLWVRCCLVPGRSRRDRESSFHDNRKSFLFPCHKEKSAARLKFKKFDYIILKKKKKNGKHFYNDGSNFSFPAKEVVFFSCGRHVGARVQLDFFLRLFGQSPVRTSPERAELAPKAHAPHGCPKNQFSTFFRLTAEKISPYFALQPLFISKHVGAATRFSFYDFSDSFPRPHPSRGAEKGGTWHVMERHLTACICLASDGDAMTQKGISQP